ncbi:SagB/ThcOx family dehydrogenase [Streptomyces massasporeus]|uniref:SagB/ThcOx family dehydrogenase n=1 Tax=Streptomyces massasporeus TaxID=67324 RepID=UPI0036FD960E
MEDLCEDRPVDLVAALARARSPEPPGPDTPAGGAVRAWSGPPRPLPSGGPADLDVGALLRLSLAARDDSGRLRPVSSAGALHPVDTELVVGAGCSLPPGRYGYDPLRHRVHHLGRPPGNTPPGVTAELSVTARRTASHYGHRAWPLLLLDTGHAAGALFLAARALGTHEPEVRLDGLAATPLAAVHVPPPAGQGDASPDGGWGQAPPDGGLGQSCSDGGWGQAPSDGGARAPDLPGGTPTPAELLARRSTPPPLPGTPSRDALRAVLTTAERAGTGDLREALTTAERAATGDLREALTTAARAGTGVLREALITAARAGDTGDLRWCAAVGPPRPALVVLSADGTTLRRHAAGEARPTLAVWAAGQAWIADAGAVLLAHGCPADADTAHIRRTHLRAGFAVHLAHVTALRHGLAARPVGSWQQADLGAALGAAPGRDWVVHGLALGTRHADEENTT